MIGRFCRDTIGGALIAATILAAKCYSGPHETRIERWLTCDECIDRERIAVRAMGKEAIPALKEALVGPSERRRELVKAKFEDTYASGSVTGLSRPEYVDSLHSNYVATYQKRAATALGDIGGSEAVAALRQAVQDSAARNYRSDVVQVVNYVNARLTLTGFGGTITPGRVLYGERVTVVAAPGRIFTPAASALIVDGPFAPDKVPIERSGNTLRFPAVANIGTHVVAVTHSPNSPREVGRLTITSLLDANDTAMVECGDADSACAVNRAPFIGSTFPFTTFVALWNTPPRADVVDYFRVQPGGIALPLTARLEWKGNANLDLLWKQCAPFVPAGNTAGATNGAVEQTTVIIPAGQCWVLLVTMRPDTLAKGPAFARLQLTSP